MTSRRGFTLKEVLFVLLIFALMFAILAPFVKMAKKRAYKAICAEHLMAISLALRSYAADHNGNYPARLGDLYPNYIMDEMQLDCPAVRVIGTKDNPDYDYDPGARNGPTGREIVVQDKDGNHKKMGKNVLRANGAVDWIWVRR